MGSENGLGDMLSGQLGADTLRFHTYWNEYQTGVNEYSQSWLQGIVDRVHNARNNSENSNIKALIQFDLPGGAIQWMQEAGYALQDPSQTGQFRRYYPTSGAGLEAYGRAMAKALEYLYNAGVAEFIETPNEPNLVNGASDPIDAVKVGQMAGQAVSSAGAEGLQLNSSSGPAILVGSIGAGQSGASNYQYNTPTEYFGTVQWWADYTIEQWWKEIPGGPSYAVTLMGTWRPSFHAYPNNGGNEESLCQRLPSGKLQDQQGDRTGEAAYGTVISQLEPLIKSISRSKKWWITETGMSSFKTNFNGTETWAQCSSRRNNGGGSYGIGQQSYFYQAFVASLNYLKSYGGYPWSGFEGVTFFQPADHNGDYGQFAGYGVHYAAESGSCSYSYPCQKAAATTFHNYYGSTEPLPPTAQWPTEALNGVIKEDPGVCSWGPNRLDIFARGQDNALWHKYWNGSSWSEWESLGGGLSSSPSCVARENDHIDVTALGTYKDIWHWTWNGSSWSAENLGGVGASGPAVCSAGPERLDFFVRGTDNALWNKYWNGSGWVGWISRGGSLTSGPSCVSKKNRVDVVALGGNGATWHWTWNGSGWSNENLAGVGTSDPAICSWGPNRWDVFVRGTDSKLWHRYWNGSSWGSGWEPLGGALFSAPDCVSREENRIDLVTRDHDGLVTHWWNE
jgi:Repeat of unknown function (DUF346)